MSAVAMPARTNAQMKRQSANTRVYNGEPTQFIVKGNGAAVEGSVPSGSRTGRTLVQPFNDELWPMLADKSQNFTAYSVKGLRFIYQASKGSAYNGQITCGFTKETSFESGFEDEPDNIINLPVSMRFQASDVSNTMEVPVSMMSQGGKSLFNPVNQLVANEEPTRYYAGTFMYCAADCTDGTDIGRWHVEYDIVLEQSQLSTETTSCEFQRDDNGDLTIISGGRYHPRIIDSNSMRISSVRPTVFLLSADRTAHVPWLTINGVVIETTEISGLTLAEVPRLKYALVELHSTVLGGVVFCGHLPTFALPVPPPSDYQSFASLSHKCPATTTTNLGAITGKTK